MKSDPPPLRSLVSPGAVTASTVRLWMRTPLSGTLRLQLFERSSDRPIFEGTVEHAADPHADCTSAFTLPGEVPGAPTLRPNVDYSVRVAHQATDERVGEVQFRTSPLGLADSPPRLMFAAMSCNQPFDSDGCPSAHARQLALLTPDALRELDVCRVLLVGDQVYTDMPEELSLFNEAYFRSLAVPGRQSILECTRQEIRELLHHRYRHFWKLPELQDLLAGFACDLTPDDHEILDNFGSAPEHTSEAYQRLRAGALDAFFDYQASRALARHPSSEDPIGRPTSFDHASEYGSVAIFTADLRSERWADDDRVQVMSGDQFDRLDAFLQESASKHVVMIVLSVPVLHLPDWLVKTAVFFGGEASDAADRWSHEKATADRDRMVGLLCAHQEKHPLQRLVIIGGDVHVGLACSFHWPSAPRPIYQLVSSALTNEFSPWLQRLTELAPSGDRQLCDYQGQPVMGALLEGEEERSQNPVGVLNFGTVEVQRISEHESTVRLRLHAAIKRGGMPRVECVFDSGAL